MNRKLTHGSLLLMEGTTQMDWEHQIPKEYCNGPRINITFRNICATQEPSVKGYQLVGDSMLLTFAQHTLNYSRDQQGPTSTSRSGLAIRGCANLLHHLPVNDNVIVMIDTNDLLRHESIESVQSNFHAFVQILEAKCSNIILLTLPPIPRQSTGHDWRVLAAFNSMLENFSSSKIHVLDTGCHFRKRRRHIRWDLFERSYRNSGRRDLIHWNRRGMDVVNEEIHHYFNESAF